MPATTDFASLPKAEQDIEEWQMAIGCLIGAAEGPRLPNARVRGVMSAIDRPVGGCSLHRESIRIGNAGVPALTGSADIKLNTRLSLRAPTEKIASRTGYSLTRGQKPSVKTFSGR